MELAAQLNKLIEDGADRERLGAWLEANAVTVAEALEGMVAIPIIDLDDMPRFIAARESGKV
ncbi:MULTISPECIES: hypothetical protein [unclassified Novosphingobium]|uniref:hypothetical protein n=1 Tax=unclassified Novosphingobium TaxID=2644732 RepID=UPI00086C08C4|nr:MULTISPECIES: hypothetical protein [unclassified Novosphingobium]MBN9143773.1 hypothetical protein [Novosphingobium sp.]ODU84380.1 MAG: hypothetical protein ABT10_03085 [Novosphingobium sp. SCN 63-17]OJX92920.1 MAG: hypothetical protein BGP00_23685 [Novosphingobium sp. 63-713]